VGEYYSGNSPLMVNECRLSDIASWTFSSNNPSVATVSANINNVIEYQNTVYSTASITAHSPGTATLTFTVTLKNGYTQSESIDVTVQ
jgi:hypothetical protein